MNFLPTATEYNVARAAPETDTLTVAMPRGVRVLDAFIATSRQNLVVQHLIDDGLLYVDPETLSIKPLAAKAYRYINPRTLEFDIRDGVTFHDGSPLTADDVVIPSNSR